MRRIFALLCAALAAVTLSACARFGNSDGDLIVCNDSSQVIYTITLSTQVQSESVTAPVNVGLLERGDRYGLVLEDGSDSFTLELKGEHGDLLARCTGHYRGKKLLLTLGENGMVSVSEA